MADLGTVTVTEERHTSVKKVAFAWLADGDGKATKTTTYTYDGKILGLATVPDSVAAPNDNYGVRIYDEDTVDVLMGGGLLRDTATTEYVLATSLGAVANDRLSLSVTGAGAAHKGVVYVYIR